MNNVSNLEMEFLQRYIYIYISIYYIIKGLLYALAKYKETYIPTYYAFESKADIIESISENESEEENSNELLMRAIKEYADLFKLKLEQENLPKTTAVYKQYFYENTLQSEEMMREILDKFENKTDIIVVALAGINSVNAQNLGNNYIYKIYRTFEQLYFGVQEE